MEIWKDIAGYDGIYQVSSYGRVKRIFYKVNKSNTILKPAKDCCGYMRCALCKDGVSKTYKVHRLVAQAFISKGENNEVNHKNGLRDDNRVENLEWVTHLANIHHSINKLGKKGTLTGKRSENHPRSRKIFQYAIDGEFINEFNSEFDAHKESGISHSNINSCCRGKRSSAGGYVWKYKN